MSESHIDPHMMRPHMMLPAGEHIASENYLRTRIAKLSHQIKETNETIVLQARRIVRLVESVKRVTQLHAKMSCDCIDCKMVGDLHEPVCKACGDDYAYPCPTIKAIQGTSNVQN